MKLKVINIMNVLVKIVKQQQPKKKKKEAEEEKKLQCNFI